MIKLNTLSKSIEEAERFIEAAKILKGLYKDYYTAPGYGSRSASVKRASMDLTRKLSDLRQGR